ncbi:MAG: L-sorbosone dehydrogenase [Candidatus Eremiobacteraeota bacterium]|nr:L-sorbosone dehydrogenase [Candidatus Eremiobacteraeota bacterium]
MRSLAGAALLACALAACSGGGGTSAQPVVNQQVPPGPGVGGGGTVTPTPVPTASPAPTAVPTATPQPTAAPTATPVPGPSAQPADPNLHVPSGFIVSKIASGFGARELAALPNGDLIAGTTGSTVAIVPNAESPGAAGAVATFADIADAPVSGVAYGSGFVFVATRTGVYRIAYTTGARSGTPQKIASVRTQQPDVGHNTTSVAVSGSSLYVGVGSTCNACAETDPTRATILRMGLDGSGMTVQARRWRNPIGIATDPSTGTVWAGGAGQDSLPQGHPYEYADPVSSRTAPADYGWPDCEENHIAYTPGANCANVVVPAVTFPAYATIIGMAIYPASQTGAYTFPSAWRGGMFVGLHGSWHVINNIPVAPPHVAFVPFSGASPARPVNWSDPTTQWNDFFTGFQNGATRFGRPTGVAVGAQGSLFVADDDTGSIYRIRPAGTATSSVRRR